VDYARTPALATLTLPDLDAKVIATEDTFVLWWTDCVTNEWTETHPDLGTALARLAVLAHCVTHGEGFDVEPVDFTPVAAAFLDSSMTTPQPANSVGESPASKGGRRWAWFGR
jgi:hypothetical protein